MTVVRLEKLHPDGSLRRVGRGHRIADVGGAMRVYCAAGSRFWHVNGVWTTSTAWVSVFHPEWPFVPHRSFHRSGPGIYIDVARDVRVSVGLAVFTDLYLDLLVTADAVAEKDEELLLRLSSAEAAGARATRDELRRRIDAHDPLFALDHPLWQAPDGAAALPPLDAEELG